MGYRGRGKLRFVGTVRLKGTRQAYDFSWEGLFLWAVEQKVMKERAEKKRLRDAKKKGR